MGAIAPSAVCRTSISLAGTVSGGEKATFPSASWNAGVAGRWTTRRARLPAVSLTSGHPFWACGILLVVATGPAMLSAASGHARLPK